MTWLPNITGAPIPRKSRPREDVAFRKAWAAERLWCQCCGGAAGLWFSACAVHHVVKRGRSGGADDSPTNLLMACLRCHELMEGQVVVYDGVRRQPLPFGSQLTLKATRDPGEYDAARLAELHGGSLPVLEPLPAWIEQSWRRCRGEAAHEQYLMALLALEDMP